jgi:GT2 family glycosyltransferase
MTNHKLHPSQAQHADIRTKASIIIVSYNSMPYLSRCLQSLVFAGYKEVETIVVDNASKDSSPKRVADNFPHVHLESCQKNLGFGAGNNLGASLANSEYLAFLNPDTLVEPGWLEALVNALQADPRIGLVTSKILLLDNPGRINTCGNNVHLSGLTLCRGMGEPCSEYNHKSEVGSISGAAFAIRRELFQTLSGFDEDFFLYMEDTDISLRARLAGYPCIYVPDSVVYHEYTLKFTPDKTYYQERNRYMMLMKSFKWVTLLVLLPILVLAEVVTWGFALVRDRKNLGNKFRAYAWVVSRRDLILAKRREIQSKRCIPDKDLLKASQYDLDYEQTGTGWAATLGRFVFDPLFYIFSLFPMKIVFW